TTPLPAEIDPNGGGRRFFSASGPERVSFALIADCGQGKPLRYEAEIARPEGRPLVRSERLTTIGPLHPNEKKPFTFLDFHEGSGIVRDQFQHVGSSALESRSERTSPAPSRGSQSLHACPVSAFLELLVILFWI